MCVEVSDPRERELPDAGTVVMVDPESGRHLEADLSSPKLRAAFATAERARALRVATDIRRAAPATSPCPAPATGCAGSARASPPPEDRQ